MGDGVFVAVEGIEGAGKTTQVALLADRMRSAGMEVTVVREPGGTEFAEAVRQLVLHAPYQLTAEQEVFLFQAARSDLVERVIRPALEQGKAVLADRFELSTRCYQGVGRGLDAAKVGAAIDLATGGLLPDLYVVLDLAVEDGRGRQALEGKARDRIERADDGFHRRVAEAFRKAAGPNIVHVAGGRPAAAVHEEIWAVLAVRFPRTFSVAAG
jgi:dTMP kinase